jgi:membrane-anchored protein YejM (alkaline phosphatase superfamily)
MILDPNQPFVDKAQRLSSWGHWFTFFNILLALVIACGFIVTDTLPISALGFAYLITNWVGHTAFLTFIGFVLSIFPLSLIFPYPRHIRGMAAVIATSAMILLTIDAYSYSRLGYHISGASLEQVVSLLTTTWNDHPLRSFLWVFGICTMILVLELLISNVTWKRLEQLREKAFGARFTVFFLSAFMLSHMIHIWADATFDYDVTKQNNMFPFSYPATAKTLLAKNGLLDEEQHQVRRTNQLSLKQNLTYYPVNPPLQCDTTNISNDLQILLSDTVDSVLVSELSALGYTLFDKHYVPTNTHDAIFNLLYGLPSIYKDSAIANAHRPQWYNLALSHQLNVSLDIKNSPAFAGYRYIADGQQNHPGAKTITIKQVDNRQLSAYLGGLNNTNVIVIGTQFDSAVNQGQAIHKTPLLIKWANPLRYKGQVSQNLDISPAIIQSWLNCKADSSATADNDKLAVFGKNLLIKQPKQLAANYTNGTIVSIQKDKITLLDEQGNSQTLSASNGYPLNQAANIPRLNDTINLLKQYSQPAKP